jgi:hypothetical protein
MKNAFISFGWCLLVNICEAQTAHTIHDLKIPNDVALR